MGLDWKAINKALSEHWEIVTAPMLDNRHHYGYNPKRLNYADFLKTEERRQEMNADLFTKNKTDIALLRRCIEEKWIPIYEGRKTDEGDKDCVLCKRYAGCEKCPIREASGCIQCGSTPYVTQWKRVANFYETADTPEKRLAALQEITYLEGLIAKLTKAEEEEKEKRAVEAAEKARIEKEKRAYHPHVFYLTLEEPTTDSNMRVHVQQELVIFLKKLGMKISGIRYSFGRCSHLTLDTETGNWRHVDIPISHK